MGGLQPVNSFDFRESHRELGFWSFLQHASLWSSEQSVKQAAFASALGPSCSESAHYSGHHAGMIIMLCGYARQRVLVHGYHGHWYLRQDDGTEDADSTVAELCALLEQACRSRGWPLFKGLSHSLPGGIAMAKFSSSSWAWLIGIQHDC